MIIFGDKKIAKYVADYVCCCMHLKFGTCIAEKGMLLWEKYQEIKCFGAPLLVTNREITFSSKIWNKKKLWSDIQRLIVRQNGTYRPEVLREIAAVTLRWLPWWVSMPHDRYTEDLLHRAWGMDSTSRASRCFWRILTHKCTAQTHLTLQTNKSVGITS